MVNIAEVQDRGTIIAEHSGESRIIYEIIGRPRWLVKLYIYRLSAERARELEDLIVLPARMNDTDRALIDSTVAWPVAQVVDNGSTVGVIIAKASDQFFASITTLPGRVRRIPLEFDHLAMPEEDYAHRGLDPPSPGDRLRMVRKIVAVGELLERYGIVFGDWSYSNEFWAEKSHEVFVIDVDPCGFTKRPWVESNRLADPLVPDGDCITTYTDRYKLAVLTVRGLTGVRSNEAAAVRRLPASVHGSALQQVLTKTLTATTLQDRPVVRRLLEALDDACRQLAAREATENFGYGMPSLEPDFEQSRYEAEEGLVPSAFAANESPARRVYRVRPSVKRRESSNRLALGPVKFSDIRVAAITIVVIVAMILAGLFIWGPL
jgi:hypothetical protein